jgi:hypothetical protein
LSRNFPEGTFIPSRREKDIDTLRSKPQISSEEITLFHVEVMQEECRSRGTLQGFRINKLRRNSDFAHRAISKRRRRKENPLENSELRSSGGTASLKCRLDPSSQDSQRRQRLRSFGTIKYSKFRKKTGILGGSYSYRQISWRGKDMDCWVYVQATVGGEHSGRERDMGR